MSDWRPAAGEHPLAIGLGGNLGGDQAILERFRAAAIALDSAVDGTLSISPVYRSEPVGPVADQPAFLNAVAIAPAPDVPPEALMAALLDLEAHLGRDRRSSVPQGPREIDLDLLVAGATEMVMGGPAAVIVPHPRLGERAFAMRPLADLVGGDYRPPGWTETLQQRLAALGDQGLTRLGDAPKF